MKSALSACFLLLSLPALSQPVTELRDSLVIITQTADNPFKTRALLKSDKSWIAAGQYKIAGTDREHFFQVGDSGLMIGSSRTCYDPDFCHEKIYERGLLVRENFWSKKRLINEKFDSLVNVMLYNSKIKKWVTRLTTVNIEKTYTPSGRIVSIRYAKGPYNTYASYQYNYGVLISEIIPHYQEKKWNQEGQLYEHTLFNWPLQQIEIARFENGVLHQKMIMKSPAYRWSPEGVIHYSADPNAPVFVTTYTFAEGKRVIKKELEDPGKRTVTEYNEKGKVVSVNVYPKSREKAGQDVAAPVEVKQ